MWCVLLSLGHLYDLKSPYDPIYIYIYIYAWIGVMQMTNGLILNRAIFNNLRFKKNVICSTDFFHHHLQTAKVVVVAVERERRQLRFSEKATEGEGQELAQKKAQLMVSSRCRLSVPPSLLRLLEEILKMYFKTSYCHQTVKLLSGTLSSL